MISRVLSLAFLLVNYRRIFYVEFNSISVAFSFSGLKSRHAGSVCVKFGCRCFSCSQGNYLLIAAVSGRGQHSVLCNRNGKARACRLHKQALQSELWSRNSNFGFRLQASKFFGSGSGTIWFIKN